MRRIMLTALTILIFGIGANAQQEWQRQDKYISADTVQKGRYTLIFINADSSFAASGDDIKNRMKHAFFKVYPKLAAEYNDNTARRVTFIIDPQYKGVAATSGAVVRYNPQWMLKKPLDLDVVTHEVMHIVQAYHGKGERPGWLTEGIADYARYKYGVANEEAGWKLTPFNEQQQYENSYRITARFLVWVEAVYNNSLVRKLNNELRKGLYTTESWKRLTGKSLAELWAEYKSRSGRLPAQS